MARKIRCITFDCYGTLIDWQGGIESALLAVPAIGGDRVLVRTIVTKREEIEKPMLVSAPDLPEEESAEETYETPEYRPYREILAESILLAGRECGIELSGCEAEQAAATMPHWEPFSDTRRALAELRAQFQLAILSNVEDEVIAASIEKLGVPFDLVITAEQVESYKPAPDHWYAAMHELEADEEEIFHLGASPFHDLETATLLGIPCGYVNRGGYPLTKESHPLFVVPDLGAAAARLRGFASGVKKRPPAHRAGKGPITNTGGGRSVREGEGAKKRPPPHGAGKGPITDAGRRRPLPEGEGRAERGPEREGSVERKRR